MLVNVPWCDVSLPVVAHSTPSVQFWHDSVGTHDPETRYWSLCPLVSGKTRIHTREGV